MEANFFPLNASLKLYFPPCTESRDTRCIHVADQEGSMLSNGQHRWSNCICYMAITQWLFLCLHILHEDQLNALLELHHKNYHYKGYILIFELPMTFTWLMDWNSQFLQVNFVCYENTYLPNPSARAGYDTRSIFKRSLTVLNSEFSFS